MKKSILYVLVILMVLLSVAPVYAVAYNINGTISRADTMVGLADVTVTLNTTNTTTTNATGFYSLANVKNGTFSVVVTVPNDGYVTPSTLIGLMDGADNTTSHANLTVTTPTISGITETSIGRTSAIIAWTPSISTIGNRIIYTRDSGLANNLVTSSWSNGTVSPSFTLSGLDIFNTYYYRIQVYNTNNASYSATSDGDFKTLAGNPEEDPESYELVSVPQPSGQSPSIVTQAQNQVTKSKTNKIIAFGVIIVVLYLVLFGKKKK